MELKNEYVYELTQKMNMSTKIQKEKKIYTNDRDSKRFLE